MNLFNTIVENMENLSIFKHISVIFLIKKNEHKIIYVPYQNMIHIDKFKNCFLKTK